MAQKGRIIKDGAGGIVADVLGNQIEYTQPFSKELCIDKDDIVRFEPASIDGKVIATNLKRYRIGIIQLINSDNSSGILTEKVPNLKRFGADLKPKEIKFFQANLTELGISVGDQVDYDLVRTAAGEVVAVNLNEN